MGEVDKLICRYVGKDNTGVTEIANCKLLTLNP